MANERNEHFYDLAAAAAITRRLASQGEKPAAEPPRTAPRYASLGHLARKVDAAVAPLAPAPVAPATPAHRALDIGAVEWTSALEGSDGWARLLEWCVSGLGADGAFVVDDRGLVIASHGLMSREVMEQRGARLVFAFEQAARIADGARSLSIELDDGWLIGLRVAMSDSESLTIGVQAPQPLAETARRRIEDAFTRKAHGM